MLFDGFYEWKVSKNTSPKQPYYIYAKQESNIKVDDPKTWPDKWSLEFGWEGYKPLKMAGIFNTFKTVEVHMNILYNIHLKLSEHNYNQHSYITGTNYI